MSKAGNRAYLDTSVLVAWVQVQEAPKRQSLPKAASKCKHFLEFVINDRLNCNLQTSDWALSEMVQYFRDRAILRQFLQDGFEISAFSRHKHEYSIGTDERGVIHDVITDFEKYLQDLEVGFLRLNMDRHKIHEYCLRYSLETPDAMHLLVAIQEKSHYLVTIDRRLIDSKVKEIAIIDPGNLISKRELRY